MTELPQVALLGFEKASEAVAIALEAIVVGFLFSWGKVGYLSRRKQFRKDTEEWEFSSYLEYAGLRAGTLPNQRLIREIVGGEGMDRSFLDSQSLTVDKKLLRLMLDE